jgi:hypothetical protein
MCISGSWCGGHTVVYCTYSQYHVVEDVRETKLITEITVVTLPVVEVRFRRRTGESKIGTVSVTSRWYFLQGYTKLSTSMYR